MKGLFLNTWAPSTVDGAMPVTNMFGGGANDYLRDPDLARLVAKQRTIDGDDRIAVFAELAGANIATGALIPLYSPETVYVTDPSLSWKPRADGLFTFEDTAYSARTSTSADQPGPALPGPART